MAEIYIADKPTLDTVNAKMDAAVSTRAAQTTAILLTQISAPMRTHPARQEASTQS